MYSIQNFKYVYEYRYRYQIFEDFKPTYAQNK